MSEVIPHSLFPTPYGVTVEVMRNPDVPEDHDTALLFSTESAAIMAGIHDPTMRLAYAAEVMAALDGGRPVMASLMTKYGGRRVPTSPITKPVRQFYDSIPTDRSSGETSVRSTSMRDVIDMVVDAAMENWRWCDRAAALLHFFEGQMDVGRAVPDVVMGGSLSIMVAAVLENLGEREIDCLEAAAFYSLAPHPEWRIAGLGWLLPFRETWFFDWATARPVYQRLARSVSAHAPEIPSWLSKPAQAPRRLS